MKWIENITGKNKNPRKVILYLLVTYWLKYKEKSIEKFKDFIVYENNNIDTLLNLNITHINTNVNKLIAKITQLFISFDVDLLDDVTSCVRVITRTFIHSLKSTNINAQKILHLHWKQLLKRYIY
jgi:ABC-type iron transport system FetAB ATPase subunit